MRVLIADPEPERARRIAAVCTDRNLVVETVGQGAVALERSIESPPDLLICPLDLPILDGAKLAEILRNNPRSRGVSFIYLLEDALDAPVGMEVWDRIVLAPWQHEQISEGIMAALERGPRLGDARSEHEIEGSLAQISLVDLLQLLQLNKKTGTVGIIPGRPHPSGSILLRDGEIVDATVPANDGHSLYGQKALFRLLDCRRGRFEFAPRDPGGEGRIQIQTRELLLEGLRQLDEGRRLRQGLPAGVRVRPDRTPLQLPAAEQAIAADVLEAVEGTSSVDEVLDRLPFSDHPILRTLYALLTQGVLEPATAAQPGAPVVPAESSSLLTSEQASRIRDWAAAQRPPVRRQVRVAIVASDPRAFEVFAASARSFPDARLLTNGTPPSLERVQPLAEATLGEGMVLSLLGLPADPRFRPLWAVVFNGMLGALVVVSRRKADGGELAKCIQETIGSGRCPIVPIDLDAAEEPAASIEAPSAGDVFAAAVREALSRLVP